MLKMRLEAASVSTLRDRLKGHVARSTRPFALVTTVE
jgi:hypothetical protein